MEKIQIFFNHPGHRMAKLDYLKVIDILAKTLNMEIFDMKFQDKTGDKFEVIMSGTDKTMKTLKVSLLEDNLDLTFLKNYLSKREFDKWLAEFEYELEQEFLHNINVHAGRDASNYIIKVRF